MLAKRIIPCLDVDNGRVVKGVKFVEIRDAGDPVEIARRYDLEGADELTFLDITASSDNRETMVHVVEQVAGEVFIPLSVGGGIRDLETIEGYIDAGVDFVIIGTKAVSAPHFVSDITLEFPNHVIVGLDAKDGKVAIDGWSKLSHHDVIDLAQKFEDDGVDAIIYTDISRDGMMGGVNIEATSRLACSIRIPVIASGGITNLDDIKALGGIVADGVMGAITGRAIYEGTLDFEEARKLAETY